MLLDNLRHVIQYFFIQLISLINWLLTQIGRLVFYKFAILFSKFKRLPNRTGWFFNPLSTTNASSEVRPILGIINDWCSNCQYWNSSFLILCLKYHFLLHILLYLLFFWVFIIFDRYYCESVIEKQFINHKRPRILLFIFLEGEK